MPGSDGGAVYTICENGIAHTAARFPNQYCLMLLDGAGWHRALAPRVPEHMQLLCLPPYSPELNPAEHLWDHLRENYLDKRAFHSLQQVIQQLCQGLKNLHQQPERVQSETCFDWLNTQRLTVN